MSAQPDYVAGLKKLLAQLKGEDGSTVTVLMNDQDVTKSGIASLKHEITSLESRFEELRNTSASRP